MKLLTSREAADIFAVSTETVLRWVRRGKLPAIRLPSGAIRFQEDALERRLEEWATPVREDASRPAGRRPPASVQSVSPVVREVEKE